MPPPELKSAVLGLTLLIAACGSQPAATVPHLVTGVRALHEGQVIDGVPCLREDLPQRHIHVHLQVLLDGGNVTVPAGIGVGRPWGTDGGGFIGTGTCFAWIHTHDVSGVVHIVTPEEKSFSLRQLFEVWGQPLAAGSALGYRGPVTVLVDGSRFTGDARQIPLTNLANIVVELGKPPRTTPPVTYDFRAFNR